MNLHVLTANITTLRECLNPFVFAKKRKTPTKPHIESPIHVEKFAKRKEMKSVSTCLVILNVTQVPVLLAMK